ncbi:hypothetical protein ES708_18995 [subsurface metagenome]
MKTLRSVWMLLETLRGMFLVLDSVQASKLASFYSLFWACFLKLRLLSGWLNVLFWMGKTSMLVASAWALRIVTVTSYCEVVQWQNW